MARRLFRQARVACPVNSLAEHLQAMGIQFEHPDLDLPICAIMNISDGKDGLINMIMCDSKFNPNSLITDAESKTVKGWRKTIKWTDSKGRMFKLTTGEGPMFDDSDNDTEDDAKEDEAVGKQAKPDSLVSVELEMESIVDPAKSTPKSFLNVESLKSSLESPDNTISFSQEQLALMYSDFNKFNKMT